MSTLPFLLSVADELDNIHTQSYMDDFGLGFHPHRQYYRTPTIQLSLPASTEWTSGRDWQGRHARYRSYKYYDESQSKLDEQLELELEQQQQQQAEQLQQEQLELEQQQLQQQQQQQQQQPPQQLAAEKQLVKSTSHDVGVGGLGLNLKAAEEEDDENIDRTVRMYNLSKKCCKNYYRHALEMDAGNAVNKCSQLRSESQHSSFSSDDDESMPKLPSPIEFLTCFLIKKSSSSHRHAAAAKQS